MEYIIHDGTNHLPWENRNEKQNDGMFCVKFDRPRTELWREENWFCAELYVEQSSAVGVKVTFLDADGNKLMAEYEILPNLKVNFRLRIDELWSRRCFLEVFPGSYKGMISGLPMDPRDVTSIEIAVRPGENFISAVLGKVWISEERPAGVEPDAPIVDEMGQQIGCEWETKTHSFEEMKARLLAEYEEARNDDHPFPNRSRWGGFLEKQFEATGWFRVQHDGRRWWLVDPDGYAFFSHGLCYGTRMGEFGWYTGMEKFYENAPTPDDPKYAGAFTRPGLIAEYVKRHGVTERSDEWMYNPARGNMIRIFGEEWWEAWRQITTHRFHKWGINTTGVGIVNFVDERCEDFLRMSNLPYMVTLKRFPVTKNFIFRDFPDVFAPEYEENSTIFAENELGPHAGNRNLIGYFMHNEPEWMIQDDCNVAWELLVKDEPLKSREHLANWLKERYDSIHALNEAWGIALDSFEMLLEPLSRETVLSEQGWEDLKAYEQILIEAFSGIPLNACRKVSPNHLCLGMRYDRYNSKLLASCKAFDIVSFNCYLKTPEERIRQFAPTNKPVIIGEWHFTGPGNGLLRSGLQRTANQEERGKAYRRYCEMAAAEPNCVGISYFEYNSQSLMGRFDGEHMAHGLIDCCNRPYPELVEAIKTSSAGLYDIMTGKAKPYDEPVRY